MHDGFLLDPESETARYFTTDAKPFSSITCAPCLVLLGDPGLGKSHELLAEYDRVREAGGKNDVALRFELRDFTSEDRLEKRLFGCSEMLDWFQSNKRLHLFLDGFDEGLLRVDTISRILVSGFSSLPFGENRYKPTHLHGKSTPGGQRANRCDHAVIEPIRRLGRFGG